MNIFALDKNPRIAASYHLDKHVPKMIVETAQMLSTAHHIIDGQDAIAGIYKEAHVNHPCSIWARESTENYRWLHDLGMGLIEEYHLRYGNKVHKTESVMEILKSAPKRIVPWGLSMFAQAMPDQYKDEWDGVKAYRAFYRGEKHAFAEWRLGAPDWWQ
jgi:hypothetical protein